MALITSISNGEAGSSVRTKLNTAMASVEVDGTSISGTGLSGAALAAVPGGIDHNSLNNYSAAEHYTQANITEVGTLTTGNVDAAVSSALITGATTVTAVTGDFVLISDTSDSGNLKKVNASDFISGTYAINDLTDVTITAAAAGEVIRYNGSNWTDAALAASDIQSGTFADARIAASNVTQHQASITGLGTVTSGTLDGGDSTG